MNNFDLLEQKVRDSFSDAVVLNNELLSKHTSFKIGGPAKLFITPGNVNEFKEILFLSEKLDLKSFVLGKGSNVLFDDGGYDGVVISTSSLSSISAYNNTIVCECGVPLTAASLFASEKSLSGMSFGYGIPGSIGGAVFMNAGAYNGEISFILKESLYYDSKLNEVNILNFSEHQFDYRFSSYRNHPERVILSATFEMQPGNSVLIKSEMDEFMSRRKEKQPLEYPSAGSTFKRYPGRYTAQMIEQVGLKGTCVGGAEISKKHAGFIINKGNASSADVLSLIDLVKNKIRKEFNIEIEAEVIYVEK